MVHRNTPLNGTLQSLMQILQGRQAHTDIPLSHAAQVQMGINHAPQPTAEILSVKDKMLSSPTQDGIQQLLSHNYQRSNHTSSK